MITKERLEEAIRGVIREFKRSKRIPDPAADELTAALLALLFVNRVLRFPGRRHDILPDLYHTYLNRLLELRSRPADAPFGVISIS